MIERIVVEVGAFLCHANTADNSCAVEVAVTRPHPVDVHVGKRLRMGRLSAGMTQTDLAEAVGITYQQIQKYENGVNRMGASRLFEFASVLGVDVLFFFQGVEHSGGHLQRSAIGARSNRVDLELAQRISEVEDPDVKRKLLALVDRLAAVSPRATDKA